MKGIAAYLLAAVIGLAALAQVAGYAWQEYGNGMPDGVADKYLTVAAWDGYGSDRTLDELARHYGITGSSTPARVTRTPGAFILQVPLLAISDGAVLWVLGLASLIALLIMCAAASRLARIPYWASGLLAAVLAGSFPMVGAYLYGTTGVVASALAIWAWVWKDRPRLAGPLLAAAAVLKVWPVLLAWPLLAGNRRTVRSAFAWAVAVTGVGLLLPGAALPITDWQAWADGRWNWSLLPWWPLVVATIGVMWFAWRDQQRRIAVAILAGLALSPLSWAWYWFAALPAVAVLFRLTLVAEGSDHRSTRPGVVRSGLVEPRLPTRRRTN